MIVRSMTLWVHVLCGVVWVGGCATFILAAGVLAGEPEQSHVLAIRSVLQINRLCLPLAFAIPITGIINLLFAAQARGSALPPEFLGIVAAKIGLLAVMTLALAVARRALHNIKALTSIGAADVASAPYLRRIIASYGVIVVAGIVALGLGLWLSGT
jgi:hypothetical protein